MMFSHHIITLALIICSYATGYTRVGVLVLMVHNGSDMFGDVLKMVNYMGLHGKANFFITETSFLMVIVTWPFFRLYLLPSKIIYSSLFEATPSSLVCNGTVGPVAEG